MNFVIAVVVLLSGLAGALMAVAFIAAFTGEWAKRPRQYASVMILSTALLACLIVYSLMD